MRLVSTINQKLSLCFFLLLASLTVSAQENSPFSRYGIGDIFNGQHIANRGIAGISSPYRDAQSINFYNPASYSALKVVTFDMGVGIDSRTLRNANPVKKYTSVNFTPSYVVMGFPIDSARKIGFAFGLRPLSKINYSILDAKRLTGIDSTNTLYEGTGGLNQLFVGIGKQWGGLSIGLNTGVRFGRKETSTKVFLVNDTVNYYSSNSGTITTFAKSFLDLGLQYVGSLNNTTQIKFGFSANLQQKLKAKQDFIRETFAYDNGGSTVTVDSVYQTTDKAGTIEMPGTYTAGISLNKSVTDRLGNKVDKSMLAIEYETAQWTKYRFYGQPDKLINSWQFRIGGQFTPNPLSVTNYWNRVTFRAGVHFGKDYINADGKELAEFGITTGAALPIRKWRSFDNQFTVINTALEFGKRGSSKNNITESYFRIAFGVSLSDIWFIKRKYD